MSSCSRIMKLGKGTTKAQISVYLLASLVFMNVFHGMVYTNTTSPLISLNLSNENESYTTNYSQSIQSHSNFTMGHHHQYFVGKRIAKRFEGQISFGSIVAYSYHPEVYWRVEFDGNNGGIERFDTNELMDAFSLYQQNKGKKYVMYKNANEDETYQKDEEASYQRYAALWSGEERCEACEEKNVKKVEIALAYCKADLSWLTNEIVEYINIIRQESNDEYVYPPDFRLTILSKCGNDDSVPDFAEDINNELDDYSRKVKVEVNIVNLVNKGGCDLAYLHFVNQYLDNNTEDSNANSIVLFLKDSPRTKESLHQNGRWRTIPEMIHYASKGEFICGIKPECEKSVFHDTTTLKKFLLKDYVRNGDKKVAGKDFNAASYDNLGDFVKSELDYQFPEKLTEVCYGGSFAVPATRLFAERQKLKRDLKHFEQLLTNGPHMSVEEHFAERLWAAFFSNPLDAEDAETMLSLRRDILEFPWYMGTLTLDADSHLAIASFQTCE